ncbi:hypothetical protein LBR04_06580 [Levilactobacillus brevis]|nr:hypothetical protein LBR04_06580 [Levilactobacillus brevis]
MLERTLNNYLGTLDESFSLMSNYLCCYIRRRSNRLIIQGDVNRGLNRQWCRAIIIYLLLKRKRNDDDDKQESK